ncbi:MAG: NADH-quinone oxidoreductase subunit J [Deltaproteobacteria bacterium]|nr:NADH-quinone oxidoreductase subunit J [Deltaproteobacteria bacterium]
MLISFYILAALAVGGALSVVLFRSPVYCALSLVATFLCLAGIYVLLNSEFVAAIQVLIYAGAIMVLFLFVIMLLNLRSDKPLRHSWTWPKLLGIGFAVAIIFQLIGIFHSPAARMGPAGKYSTEYLQQKGAVEVVGEVLFTEYVLPFEIISILLMVAVVGAVILAKRREPASTEQTP